MDLAAALDEPRHRPAAPELAVVRVRREDERFLPGLDHRAIQSLDVPTVCSPGMVVHAVGTSQGVTSRPMEHMQLAEIAALLGALGAVGVLIPRGGVFPLIGFLMLGIATGALVWSLVGDNDVELLLGDPAGIALVIVGVAAAVACAVPFARYPAVVPVALLAVAPFRLPVQLGAEEAFLLVPLYLVIAAAVLALAYRILRGERPAPLPFLRALPLAAFVTLAATSFLWTWDERAGGIALAFFVFPFTAGLATLARSPLANWLPRALLVTLVAMGTLFAAIGNTFAVNWLPAAFSSSAGSCLRCRKSS